MGLLGWASVVLTVAGVAAIFGFGGVVTAAARIAKLLFFVLGIVDKERSSHMAGAVDDTKSVEVDKIKDDLQQLRDDLGKLLGHVGSFGKGKLGGTCEKVSAAVEDFQGRATDRLRGTTREASERGYQAVDASRDAVQQKPLTYVAAAFVAGMILASFLEWKRSS